MTAKKPFSRVYALLPGILLAAVVGIISIFAADVIGTRLLGYDRSPVSSVMVALILGMAVGNTLKLPAVFEQGLQFSVKRILRLGIILLGIRLSIGQVARLGAVGVPIVIGCICAALIITMILARVLHLPRRLGTLIAVGTSICGVSAIVATAPAIHAKEEEVAYAVSVITIFGLVATIAYPLLARQILAGDSVSVGLFLGTAIHDTSQVTGAGLVYSELYSAPEALNAATVTKLVRNLFMGLVIPIVAIMRHRESGESQAMQNEKAVENKGPETFGRRLKKIVPIFILGFIGLAILRTIGDATCRTTGKAFGVIAESLWGEITSGAKTVAIYCLVTALAGVGMRIRFSKLVKLGIKPLIAGFGAAIAVGAVSIILVKLLGPLVRI